MKTCSFRILIILLIFSCTGIAQNKDQDSIMINKLFTTVLTEGKSYEWLDHLANEIGGRLSGSIEAERAVKYTEAILNELGLDNVWLQPVMVPKWTRGFKEYAYLETAGGQKRVMDICALGGSIATPSLGIKAEVVEVQGIEELASLGKEKLSGKIVFFNRPMNPSFIHTYQAYGEAADQRYAGAKEAAKYGAVGVLVRSLTHSLDDYPHTGSMTYGDLPSSKHIPAAAISTNGAEYLSSLLKLQPDLKFYYKMNCKTWDDVQSYNVIGEITGSTYPDEYMVVGAHLDSWDLADGAQDDGAGVVQSMEVLHLFKKLGYKPKHTIRAVLFMNEENGLRGGKKYAEEIKRKGEKHRFAIESDAGGFTPRGFSFDTNAANLEKAKNWKSLFEPYLIHLFEKGYAGADINPMKGNIDVLAGLVPDGQRYFNHHHAATDTFDAVNKRELELGAATMASILYLFDRYGTN
ncbi:M20/M25/M40 family metallo-hydrolase [Aequorivita viscosa]|uniref:Carboxypeptidase Q n=1 Tax=Aequorivita viscosa TaxID=797419 RepID=A0A1M6GBJ8_9FLAO|nr:M20/M25/M40 family metallo-hydrolase [Aequorivita viscosa]SDW86388.1 Peptidase family M28 [Aequorivita viscosa]SHJ07295.1 PA domain-containing protein [Aequorivita viscosa]